MTREWKHNRMLKPWSNGKAIQLAWARKFATVSLRLGWEKLDRRNWGEVSQHELKGVERRREMRRELRRVKKMCTEMKVVEKSWREVRSRWKSWEVVSRFATRGQKSWKRAWKSAAAPGKPVSGSYSVTLLKPGSFRHPPCAGSTCKDDKKECVCVCLCLCVYVCMCVCIFACIFAQVAKQNCGSDGASCGKGKKILYIRIYDMYIYIYIYHTCALKPAITSHNQPNVHPSIPAAKNSSTPIGSCSSVGHRKRRSELMASQLITLRSKSWQGRGCCYQLLPADLRIDNIMIPNPDFVAKSMGCDQLKLRLNQKIFGIHSEARASLSLFKQTTWEFHKKMGSGPPATTSGRVKS